MHFADNPWWLDVLEWGPASPHAASFDIDWDNCPIAPAAACCCRSSARPMGRRWRSGEIELRYDADEGSFSAWYFEHRLPIAPERYGEILRKIVKEAGAEESAAGKRILELASRYRDCVIPTARKRPPSRRS